MNFYNYEDVILLSVASSMPARSLHMLVPPKNVVAPRGSSVSFECIPAGE